MRVPYPIGFSAKWLDGRIDDPNAGWKGRGLWSASGDRTPWLNELGKGARPLAVPSLLARAYPQLQPLDLGRRTGFRSQEQAR